MTLFGSKRLQTTPNGFKLLQMAPNCSKCLKMAPNGSKLLKMAPNCSILFQMFPNGSKWLLMAPNSTKWLQMAHNDSKWPKIARAQESLLFRAPLEPGRVKHKDQVLRVSTGDQVESMCYRWSSSRATSRQGISVMGFIDGVV